MNNNHNNNPPKTKGGGKSKNTLDLIQESKERIQEKRLLKDKEKEKEVIDVNDLENKYRIRFSHISPHLV